MSNLKDKLIQLLQSENVDDFNSTVETNNIKDFDLSEMDFSSLNLKGINLSSFDLTGSDFSEGSLESADLTNSNLTSVKFTGTNLQYCNFNYSNLSGANFNKANLTEADFSEANLSGTDFREADLTDADLASSYNLSQAKFDKFTKWPDEHNLPEDFDTSYEDAIPGYEDDYEEDLFDGELEDN